MAATTLKQDASGIYVDLGLLLSSRGWARDLKLFARQAARAMLLGETRSKFRGRGMEFEEVRQYQPGDDIRNIDWRVSARTGGTYTKLFCEERERPVHIVVDQRNSMFFGSAQRFKSVLAAEVASALAWAALAGSDRIGGQIIGEYRESDIRAKRTKEAVLRFVRDLVTHNQQLPVTQPEQIDKKTGTPVSKTLAQVLEECRRLTRPGTAIFVVSDFHDFDPASARALSLLGRHTDISLIQIVDELEQQIPFSGQVSISDGKQRSSVQLTGRVRDAFEAQYQTRQAALHKAAVRARALYTQINTDANPRRILTQLFSK
jgi:uncharacterized protein (DUF58 family)